MKHVKSFEGDHSGDYDYEYGGHAFVLARPKKGWENLNGSFFIPFKNDEFVPCMIKGHIFNKWNKQDLLIIGESKTYKLEDFDVIENSDKGFQEMIKIYSNSKKYNL